MDVEWKHKVALNGYSSFWPLWGKIFSFAAGMGNRTEPSSHYRHHDRGEETKQETTVNLNHQFISINASCALQQGIPAAVRLLRDQQEQTGWVGQLSALWFWNYMKLQCWKVSCEWRLQTLSQGQAIKICKWGPGERKWSELLTLEQTTHITGGCMKIEVKETTVTFRAQKLSDNTFT